MRHLVYRVQALPQSLLSMVWDFGQLSKEVEVLYIRQIVKRYVSLHLYNACAEKKVEPELTLELFLKTVSL